MIMVHIGCVRPDELGAENRLNCSRYLLAIGMGLLRWALKKKGLCRRLLVSFFMFPPSTAGQ